MDSVLSPELIQLIEGLKPYLGYQGKSYAETILKVMNALSSQPVRDAYQEVSNILPQLSEKIIKPLSDKLGNPSFNRRIKSSSREISRPVTNNEEDTLSEIPVKAKSIFDIQELLTNNFSLILFLILILLFFGDGGWK